jgi:hypothetical protein
MGNGGSHRPNAEGVKIIDRERTYAPKKADRIGYDIGFTK